MQKDCKVLLTCVSRNVCALFDLLYLELVKVNELMYCSVYLNDTVSEEYDDERTSQAVHGDPVHVGCVDGSAERALLQSNNTSMYKE